MKKLLRTIFIIILLLGAGFMYIVKNPELPISQKILTTIGIDMTSNGKQAAIDPNCISYFDGCNTCMVSGGIIGGCTRMYCETPAEPQCLEYANTGIDLTNCISYFDGCNNCSVKDGKPDACTLMYCETPSEPKCNEYASGTIPTEPEETPTACTEEAKLCPDGSAVGRTGPNCEFTPCPGEEPTACTMEYAPVCARVAIQCITTPCDPIEQTFGNKCMMNANKLATYLHDGECSAK